MSGQLNLKPLGALWCMLFPCSLQPPCLPSAWKAPGLAASLGKPCLPLLRSIQRVHRPSASLISPSALLLSESLPPHGPHGAIIICIPLACPSGPEATGGRSWRWVTYVPGTQHRALVFAATPVFEDLCGPGHTAAGSLAVFSGSVVSDSFPPHGL